MITATIVIPSYNEAKRLPDYLGDLCHIANERRDTEIVVSDDGSRVEEFQFIFEVITDLQRKYPWARLQMFRADQNGGKGAAIAREFLRSTSDIVGFVDADGSVSASECFRVLDVLRMTYGREKETGLTAGRRCSSVIGTRIKMLGNPVDRHPYRHYTGRIFATLVSELFHIPVYDSQCGCKFFVRDDVRNVMDFAYDKRWLWDTQLIISLFKAGYHQIEVPLSWREVPGSKVSLLKDAVRMFGGIVRFRLFLDRATRMGTFRPLLIGTAITGTSNDRNKSDSSKRVS